MDEEINNPDLDLALAKSGVVEENKEVDSGPLYRMMEGTKIPVSKHLGKLWKSRIDQGVQSRGDIEQCWSEAIRYYEHDQMSHRKNSRDNAAGNRTYQRRLNDQWSETENIVFANVTTMLPMLYAKNPSVEVTSINAANEDYAKCVKKLINALFSMKEAPGLKLKSKARRCVLWALLTNSGYFKVGFNTKAESAEGALEELTKLAKEYENAKNKSEIEEIEGKLMAIEEKLAILQPSGPTISLVNPFRLVIDPTSVEPDHSDANWIAEWDYLPTDYINAVYASKHGEEFRSVYEPTHVLNPGKDASSIEDDINNFTLFQHEDSKEAEAKNYGFASAAAFKSACYTKVWWIWDKTTRRLFLYADNKWEWPLWVWDDPLKLLGFFPYTHLWFHETPEGKQPKGEVTYYLDQQDAINDINSTIAQARTWARLNVFYDKNAISQDDVTQVLNGPNGTARGVDVPEGRTLKDVIFSVTPPALQYPDLLNAESKFAAINRLTGIHDAQRGAQFKTNTTNDAIDFYQKNVDIRVDEKIDAIEDCIGDVAWKVIQLCARYFSTEQVIEIIGEEIGQHWVQIQDPNELRSKLALRVVGGSTDKPTSKNKKRQALEIGQVLGQFGQQLPAAGIVALKVISRAFADDVVITQEDWNMIFQSLQQQMQPQQAPVDEGPQGPAQEEQLREMINSLPPEAKQAMQQMIKEGVPPTEALKQVTAAVQDVTNPTSRQQPGK